MSEQNTHPRVRNVVFSLKLQGEFQRVCRTQGEQGYGLVRIVAFTEYEACAVFWLDAPASGSGGEGEK